MNITNNIPNIFLKKLQQIKTACNFRCGAKLQIQPSEDCFVRSTNLIKQISDKQRLKTLYDETYTEVINIISKTNPVIKSLNLTKPEIIMDEYSDTEKGGGYSFIENQIGISKSIFDNAAYIIGKTDKNGVLESFLGVTSEKDKDKKLTEAQKTDNNAQLIKLTKEEQDIYVKSVLAHEIRHFIQSHLIASTENCGEKQKEAITKVLKPATDELEKLQSEYIQLCKEAGVEPSKGIINKVPDYYQIYQPKTILPKDTKLKFSIFSDDNRYWSVSEHLLNSQLENCSGKGVIDFDDDYYGNALEIDAYNFQKEFLYTFASNKPNIRKEIILVFSIKADIATQKGITILQKRGNDFI